MYTPDTGQGTVQCDSAVVVCIHQTQNRVKCSGIVLQWCLYMYGVYIQYVPEVLEEAVLEWHQLVFVVLIKNNFDLILEGVAISNKARRLANVTT